VRDYHIVLSFAMGADLLVKEYWEEKRDDAPDLLRTEIRFVSR